MSDYEIVEIDSFDLLSEPTIYEMVDLGARGPAGIGTAQSVGTLINSLAEKSTPVAADMFAFMDSEAGNIWKKISWANLWAALLAIFEPYFDTLYAIISSTKAHGAIGGPINISALFTEHTGAVTTSFTATLTNFTAANPSSVFAFTVSGGGSPTITLSAPTTPAFWTTQTLSALDDGDYVALFYLNGTAYDVWVQVKP